MKLLKPYGILWILAAFYILAYLTPLACRPMLRPDEYRYAEIPREMLETGDWVTPKMLGVRYFEKPAPGYQLTAVSFSLFGENAFALRLPSALASLLTAVLIFLLARTFSRDRAFAFLSAGIFLTFGLVFGVGTFAVLDMQLTAALTGAVVFGFLAWHSRKKLWKEVVFLVCAGVFAGVAFLIKGGLGVVIPAIVLVPFLMFRREWKRIFIYGVTVLGAAALVALPWSLAIHEAEPDFWRYFLEEEHWKRFTSATYDRKPQPFWYFIPVLFGGMLPAGLLWFAGWTGWKKRFSVSAPLLEKTRIALRSLLIESPALSFLFCWFMIPFVFFSASSCKLGTYILPCFPPLAMLAADGVCAAFRTNRASAQKWLNGMLRCFGGAILALSALALSGLVIMKLTDFLIFGGSFWLQVTTALLLFAWGCLVWRSAKEKHNLRKMALFLFGITPAVITALASLTPELFGSKATGDAIRMCLKDMPVNADDLVLVDRNTATAAGWVLKRSDLIVIGRPGEMQYGFLNYPEYASRWYQEKDLEQLVRTTPSGKRVWIMIERGDPKPLPSAIPDAEIHHADGVTAARF